MSEHDARLTDAGASAAGITGGSSRRDRKDEESDRSVFAHAQQVSPLRGESAVILTPSGKPPVKPRGYPWVNREATDEEILSWSEQVYAAGSSSGLRYAPEAVLYFARFFWDINGVEYKRVRRIILGLPQ